MKIKAVKKTIIFLLFLVIGGNGFAQSLNADTLAVYLNSAAIGDSIVLRWAPANYKSWNWGIEHGYRLERTTVMVNDTNMTALERYQSLVILDSLLLPLPEADWELMADADDMAGVGASAIHGEGFLVDSISTPGDFATAYNINQEEENRYNFGLFAADQSIEIARAMGLAYVDHTVASNKRYLYRVLFNSDTITPLMQEGVMLIGLTDALVLPPPLELQCFPADSAAHIRWSTKDQKAYYTSYQIECSHDGGNTFSIVNDRPTIYTGLPGTETDNAYYSDTLANNITTYVYRVRGRSPFGILGPPSDTIHVKGRPDPIAAHPSIYEVDEVEVGKLLIEWDFPDSLETAIGGFDLYRATKIKDVYTKINTGLIAASNRSYTDVNPGVVNYYKIVALDNNGYEHSSHASLGQLNDTIPPAPPLNISGESTPEGLVTLNWDANVEEDLLGYRVYFSNQPDTNFSQITAEVVEGNRFFYDINAYNLSEAVYFKVMAVDYRENRSPLSVTCTVQRPDHNPPVQSVFNKVSPGRDGISLQWVLSSSRDVRRHQLQRKLTEERNWTSILQFNQNNTVSSYLDTTAYATQEYQYRMLATDDAGLTSTSEVVRVYALDSGIRPPVTNLTIEQDANGNVLLRWNYPGPANRLMDFQIFRSIGGGPPRNYDAIDVATYLSQQGVPSGPGGLFFYIDDDVDNGNTYNYQIMARHLDGGMSPLSVLVTINL